MKRTHRAGFTLIEMLVTVLIIGILAAVALPQYKKAIMRSRLADLMSVMGAVERAQQATYVASGSYAWNWNELDTDVSGVFRRSHGIYYYKDFTITAGTTDPNGNPLFSYIVNLPSPSLASFMVQIGPSGRRHGECMDKSKELCKLLGPRKDCPEFVPAVEGWQGAGGGGWCF